MEKIYTCVGCLKAFKVTSDPTRPDSKQHEVEQNVECPFCSRTNAIVWRQNSFGPLVVPIYKCVGAKSTFADFYVQETCCMSCGVPQEIAPDLVGWTNDDPQQCYWVKQPQTADELERAIKIIQTQEIGCHRYSGSDPAILRRLPAEECDHLRPDLKLSHIRDFASSGPKPILLLIQISEGRSIR
jgi:hypothetical protein